MSPEDVDLKQKIKELQDTLNSLYAVRRARLRAQRNQFMTYRAIGEYWGVTAESIQQALKAPGTQGHRP